MEHHPLAHQAQIANDHNTNGLANNSTKLNSKDMTSTPCPESVLKGTHRKYYDNFINSEAFLTRLQNESTPEGSTFAADRLKQFGQLTAAQIRSFHKDGVLVIPAEEVWSDEELQSLQNSCNEIDHWPESAGKWMKYFEKNRDANGNKILSRIENFVTYSPPLNNLLNGPKLLHMVSDLFNEESILYKEKINYKLPGGEGFAPHQDVAAGWWMYNQSLHISALIGVDAANVENGCLEVVYGAHNRGMVCDPWKEIDPTFTENNKWEYVRTKPGDVVFFDSYVPHRSGINTTTKPRRVLYATYAKRSEGDYRDRYYADKRVSFPPDIERLQGKDYAYKI